MRIADEALEAVPKAADHSWRIDDMIAEIANRLTTGTQADRKRRARYIMNYHGRQNNAMVLRLPGLRPQPAIPPDANPGAVTVINDLTEDGMTFEEIDQMLVAHFPEMTPLELALCWKAAAEQTQWKVEAIKIQATLFGAWTERERAKGRPEAELVFGNFVRETGLLVSPA
jgi:hypothetical protein